MSLRVLILEDEPLAALQLQEAVLAWDPGTRILGVAESVRRGVEILGAVAGPDLVLADIQLADGLSFRLFEEAEVRCPVVFTTAYDAYVIEAFERNAIDYVLKPVQRERLAQALNKYVRLGEHYTGRLLSAGAGPMAPGGAGLERVVARKGAAFVAVPVSRIAWFTTEHKLTILVDRGGGRLMVDTPLHELEERLDRRRFFRLNRQYLAQIDAIERFRSAGKGRVSVALQPAAPDEVIVSQECAAAFRAWIGG